MFGIVSEAVKYAKGNKAFNRILKEMLIKYKSIGKFSGYIFLSNITEEESRILGAVDYRLFGQKEGKLNVNKFIKYFSQGRFAELKFEDFIKEYFKEELITNKELRGKKQEKREKYFNCILEKNYSFEPGVLWLQAALNDRSYGYSTIVKEYESHSEELAEKLYYVMKALSTTTYSEDKLQPLPLFASKITKNPHYFDLGSTASRLFISGLCYALKEKYPENIEQTNEILYKAGITRDEISISTTVYGIIALENMKEHPGWVGFYNSNEPFHVSIKNLNSISSFKLTCDYVYIFENPTVFMEVIRYIEDNKITIKPSLVCTSGQLNTASLMLLDKLFKSGVIFFYSGDFDPEGLLIADKLKTRYKDKLVLWRYSKEDYLKIKGDKGFEGREIMLNKLQSKELLEVKDIMEKEKVCGYQELLIYDYIDDIQSMYMTMSNSQ